MSDLPSYNEIFAAIAQVTKGVAKLPKGEKNTHGGYNFAGIDTFLMAVNPLCGEAELVIFQDEISSEVLPSENKKPNLHCVYEFTLGHSSGQSYGPIRKSVMVMAVGAQAYGTAQSYALKQFMRSQFLIATGDGDDPDHKAAQPLAVKAGEPQTTWHGPLMKQALKTKGRTLSTGLAQCQTLDDYTVLTDEFHEVLEQMKIDMPDWYFGDDNQPGAKSVMDAKYEEIMAKGL